MQGIEFEIDKGLTASQVHQPESWLVKLLMRFGVTDETTANFILGGLVGVLFGIMIFLYAGILGGDTNVPPSSLGHY
ncbi:MAG: hypothetical protein WAZ40_00820 [Minisyncoccia bacterium]